MAALLTALGCASAVQEWVKPGAARPSRVAVLPFENQTAALRAGQAASDLLVSELLATGAFAVMDPSEVADLLRRDNLDPADAARLPSAQRVGRKRWTVQAGDRTYQFRRASVWRGDQELLLGRPGSRLNPADQPVARHCRRRPISLNPALL